MNNKSKSLQEMLLSKEDLFKIEQSLTNHVYDQAPVGLLSGLFCAGIIFLSQIKSPHNRYELYLWSSIFIGVFVLRGLLVVSKKVFTGNETLWRGLYSVGTLLSGLSWGLAGILLLADSTPLQQMIMILMLAGVTAGSIPLSSGILLSAIVFLITSILPFIIKIATFQENMWTLFNIALSLYLLYSLILSMKGHNILKNSFILKFENDALLRDLEVSNHKLHRASTRDVLTTVPNRRYFEENFKYVLEKAKSNKKFVALLYIDLDHFKAANDQFGHNAGDTILLTVTQRLLEYLGNEDQIARLGGDELAVIIEDIRPQTMSIVSETARKICNLIATPIPYGNQTLNIAASIGISIYPNDGKDQYSLLKVADQRMYAVKKAGGNSYKMQETENFSHLTDKI